MAYPIMIIGVIGSMMGLFKVLGILNLFFWSVGIVLFGAMVTFLVAMLFLDSDY
jgi:hypothetical protein